MPNAGSQYRIMLQAVIDEKQLRKQLGKLSKKAKLNVGTGQANKNIKGVTGNIQKAIGKTLEWAAAVGLVYGALNQLREGVEFISDLNNAMTQIQMVSGMTADETERLALEYNNLAKELKATTLEVANGALEWVKQGKTAEEAQELITHSIMLSKLAFIDSAQATERLTSIMNGFKFEVEDMLGVLDKLVAVDNESATSVDEIAEALSRSSTSARLAGVEFENLVAYVSTISSVTRGSASSIGESLKTLFARLQKLKLGQLDEMGESVSDVELVLQKFTNTTLFDAENQFRDMDDVIFELSQEWENLGRVEQIAVAQAVGGIRQREKFLVLMDNFNDVLEYQAIQADSAGLAVERYETRLTSVEAASDLLRSTWGSLWIETLSSDTIKDVYELATAILELIEAFGGLGEVLKTIALLFAALKIDSIIIGISTALGGMSVATAGLMATLAPLIAIVIALAGAINLFGSAVEKAQRESREFNKSAQSDFVKGMEEARKSTEDAIPIIDAYKKRLEELRKEYEELSWWQQHFADLQGLLQQEGVLISVDIAARSETYEEYLDFMEDIYKETGLTAEQIGMSEAAYERNRIAFLRMIETGSAFEDFSDEVSDGVDDVVLSLKDLQSEMKTTSDIAKKSFEEGISYDDIVKLSEVYENYLDLLEMENGIVTLNTDKLEEYNLAKVDQMIETAEANNEDERAIQLLKAYREELDRIIPMSKDYVKHLQDMFSATEIQESGVADLANEISNTSEMFQDGEISAEGYFETINEGLENLNFAETFEEGTGAAEIFFGTLLVNSASSLTQISSMFDAGEVDLNDYTTQLLGLSDTFTMIGDFVPNLIDSMGMTSEKANEMQSVITQSLDNISAATQNLTSLQELNASISTVFWEINENNLKRGTEQHNQYMRILAEDAMKSGQVFVDASGAAFESANSIYGYLVESEKNFVNFTGQAANNTELAMEGIVNNIGTLLVNLGNAIANFKGSITITPSLVGDLIDFPAWIMGERENLFQLPQVEIGISGGFEGLGNVISNLGAGMEAADFNFDAGIYQPPSADQITGGTGSGGYTGGWDDYTSAIEDATSALAELSKEAEDFGKAQIEALQNALDAYDDLIDKRKALLQTMLKEKQYQDDLEDQQKDIVTIKNELLELARDDSEEAAARRAILEAQLAELEESLADFQFEHGVDQQIDALEADYDAFAELIAGQIDMIGGIDADTAADFREQLLAILGFIPTEGIPASNIPSALSNDIINAIINGTFGGGSSGSTMSSMGANARPDMIGGQQPSYSSSSNWGGANIDTLMEINVSGNLDESVIPEIERIANVVIKKLNDGMNLRGIKRRTDSYSM